MTFVEPRDKWGKTNWEVIYELLQEMGILQYAEISAFPESQLPNDLPGRAAGILTKDDTVSIYMLAWNPEKSAPDGSKGYYTLRKTITYSPERMQGLQYDPAYIEGRKKLGLPVTEEQEKILKTWEAEHA